MKDTTSTSKITFTNPYWSLLRTAWQFAGSEKPRYLIVYSLFICSNLVSALEPVIWGWYISALQREGIEVLRETWWYAAAYMLIKWLDWAFHGPARIQEQELAFRFSRNYLDEMYHKVLSLPLKWHQDHHSGATISRVRKAYEALKEFFENGFMYIQSFAKFILSFGAMLWFSPLFGGVGVVLGLCTVWIIIRFDRPLIKTIDAVNEKEHVVSSTLFDTLSNIVTVITLRLESRLQKGLFQKVEEIFSPFKQKIRLNEWKWFVADTLVGVIYVVVITGYMYQTWHPGQVVELGSLVMLTAYVVRFTSAFHDVAWQYNEIVRLNTDMQTARFIFEAYDLQHRPEAAHPLPKGWKEIDIRHLNYTHRVEESDNPNSVSAPDIPVKVPGLADLHLRMGRGERVALIGESGCGKSTLLALMRGLYPPDAGLEVLVDKKEGGDWASIADAVTLFPQEPEIFENTIRYNITLGLPFNDAEIMAVCDTAHFSEVVAQLPKGLDSSIMEKGVNLSGGQKQRLALARGILAAKASEIVLLDEPTSSVDPKTEVQIYDRLFSEFAEKAVVSALHRLHLLAKFDYIYVMSDGRVIESGTLTELKKTGEVFRELWQHQQEMDEGAN